MKRPIPIIDLFAGPGGLNEGFSRFRNPDGKSPIFQSKLSVEMDPKAHQTLQLRAMYRSLLEKGVDPAPYWDYVRAADHDARHRRGRQRKETQSMRAAIEELVPEGRDEAPEPLKLGEQNSLINEYLEDRLQPAEPWVLLGGPPCQAYSNAGKSRMKNVDPEKFARDHRHKLYQEYLRVVARWRPSVFVMENVRGMLSSEHGKEDVVEGTIVHQILADLENPAAAIARIDPKYAASCHQEQYDLYSFVVPPQQFSAEPSALIIRAEDHGVPQARHRVIILGVLRSKQTGRWRWRPIANGLLSQRAHPTVNDATADLPSIQGGLTDREPVLVWKNYLPDLQNAVEGHIRPILKEARDDSTLMDAELVAAIRRNLAAFRQFRADEPVDYLRIRKRRMSKWQKAPQINRWYRFAECYDSGRLNYPLNHYCKNHMASDLARYFFIATASSIWEDDSFKLKDFPDALLPKHENVKADRTPFVDRFRAQRPDRPSLTVLSHLSRDGHYFIHHDPSQIRCISVREAARLQTFPDDYFFEGGKTIQYHQVGNAVPPMLSVQLADVVHEIITQCF